MSTDAGVATITMNDPERRNVLSPEMIEALVQAYAAAEASADTRVVILRAEGPAFCAGAQLEVLEASSGGNFDGIELVYQGFLRVLGSPLPTVAVIDGPAVGAGLNLALACDLRVATDRAVFDSRFMALRLAPGGGHTWMLERLVGQQVATAMVLFGQKLSAEQALSAGLVYALMPGAEAALAEAGRLASGVARLDKDFAECLTTVARSVPVLPNHAEALSLERYMQRWSTTRPGFLDGVRSMRARVSSPPGPSPH